MREEGKEQEEIIRDARGGGFYKWREEREVLPGHSEPFYKSSDSSQRHVSAAKTKKRTVIVQRGERRYEGEQ